jgi:hypothetical protein
VWHTEDHLRVLLLLLLVETDWNHQEEEEEEDTPIMLQQVSTPRSMEYTFKKKEKKSRKNSLALLSCRT